MFKKNKNEQDADLEDESNLDSEELIEEIESDSDEEKKKIGIASWVISLVIHSAVILILVFSVIPFSEKVPDKIITTTVIDSVEEEEEKAKEVDMVKQKADIVADVMVETPVITQEEVFEDHMETENDMDTETAEGVSEAISDLPLVGSGIVSSIGGGGGGGGSFGNRLGGGRRKAVLRGGGSTKTESSVDAALAWLKRHQEPAGYWDGAKYGAGLRAAKDPAMTGLALLAFLAGGHTSNSGKYKDTVARGVRWLLSEQRADGSFVFVSNYSIYENSICALALAEAYGMSPNANLKDAAQKAIDYIAYADETRNMHHGVEEKGVPHAIGVLGWVLMALKSAKIAGLKVPDVLFDKFKARLDTVSTRDNSGRVHNCNFDHGGACLNTGVMSGVAFLSYVFLGVKKFDLEPMAAVMVQKLPSLQDYDLYRWYYVTLALFQYGGDTWKTWNVALVDVLTTTQSLGGPLDGSLQDVDGSWDPALDRWGSHGAVPQGRVYTTAMGAFCLEVYYRYASVYK